MARKPDHRQNSLRLALLDLIESGRSAPDETLVPELEQVAGEVESVDHFSFWVFDVMKLIEPSSRAKVLAAIREAYEVEATGRAAYGSRRAASGARSATRAVVAVQLILQSLKQGPPSAKALATLISRHRRAIGTSAE